MVPALLVIGANDNPNATELLVRYARSDDPTTWNFWPAVNTDLVGVGMQVAVTGVADLTDYDVQIAYRNRFKNISTWTDLGTHTAGVLSSGDASAFLWTIELNYARFDFFVPVNGAAAVGVPPAAAFTAFGTQQMAITIPGGAPADKVQYDYSGVYGLYFGGAGYVYAIQFRAKTDRRRRLDLRIKVRDNGGAAISDLVDQAFALTTAATDFSWVFHSDDPDFTGANLTFYDSVGDIASARR
jgi:hypothetical protein